MQSLKSIKRKAFTLIELLVVIAIIAILAAILFPVFAQARRAARDTATMSNLKQIATGAAMYMQDYDETHIPWELDYGVGGGGKRWVAWPILMDPYLKATDIYYDKARQTPFVVVDRTNDNWGWSTTIAVNRYGYSNRKWAGAGDYTAATIKAPASRMAFIVSRDPFGTPAANTDGNWTALHWVDGQRSACPNKKNLTATGGLAFQYNGTYKAAKDYHANGYIVSYADGHAGTVRADRVSMDSSGTGYGGCENRYFFPYGGAPAAADAEDSRRLNEFWGQWWVDN